ncbi:hypothetical protein HGRIS_000860 [Hohenbuehelia grisea]|uniref:Uncharacterized protein n=1 Tax=Hohenbuehelia grisea TaxID=104357 RepID=A0ABR3IPZ1_9AGAR
MNQPTELLESQDITYYFQEQKAQRLVELSRKNHNQQTVVPDHDFATSARNQPATSNPGEAEELGFEVIEYDYKDSDKGNAIITMNDLDDETVIISSNGNNQRTDGKDSDDSDAELSQWLMSPDFVGEIPDEEM